MQHNHPPADSGATLYTPATCPLCALVAFRALADAEVQLALGRLIAVILADTLAHPDGWTRLVAELEGRAAELEGGPDGRG